MMNKSQNPLRDEVWLVNFDPTIGDEIQKIRPAAVVSVAAAFRLRLHIVVPITSWQPKFGSQFWMIQLTTSPQNGLDKDSAANAFQVKSIAEERFIRKLGTLSAAQMNAITTAIAVCIGYTPPTL